MTTYKRTSLIFMIALTIISIGYQLCLILTPVKTVDNDVQYVHLVNEYQVLKMQRLVLEERYALAVTKQKVINLAVLIQQNDPRVSVSKNNFKESPPEPQPVNLQNNAISAPHVALSSQETKTFEQLEAYVNTNKPAQRAAFTEDEKNILASQGEDFTLQLMGVRDQNELTRFIQENSLQGAQVFHTYYLNKDWYVLVSGRYRNHTEALKALETLPDNIKELKPWIRQLTTIQKAIALYR